MDAQGDRDLEARSHDAVEILADRRKPTDLRVAAELVLGRLRFARKEPIEALGARLLDKDEDRDVRIGAAWALGELRSPDSYEVLSRALSHSMDARTGEVLLEAVAKHYAIFARDPDRAVRLVEQLTRFAANRGGQAPATYDLIGNKTRSVDVNVLVLRRASEAVEKKRTDHTLAALYLAVFELFEGILDNREQIIADEASWRARLDAVVSEAQRAIDLRDGPTARLALWCLGRLGDLPPFATVAADPVAGRGLDPSPALRLIGAWALARLQLQGTGPRRVLARDLLGRETDETILRLIADFSAQSGQPDELQKIFAIEPRSP
jgi:hypothetical protein